MLFHDHTAKKIGAYDQRIWTYRIISVYKSFSLRILSSNAGDVCPTVFSFLSNFQKSLSKCPMVRVFFTIKPGNKALA